MNIELTFILITFISTLMYLYLMKKTKIHYKYIFIDNPIVILITCFIYNYFSLYNKIFNMVIALIFIPTIGFLITNIRFWRKPVRTVNAKKNEIVSPADGNIIYIKKIEDQKIPVLTKQNRPSYLNELSETSIIKNPYWLIGINMTPFDVHRNCAPVSGTVVLNKHYNGKYLSLKSPRAVDENERNTIVIQKNDEQFGIIQIASRLVRRIDSYIKVGDIIKQGDWIGMIRFGSQVDLLLPNNYKVNVKVGNQVYAKKTKIAKKI